jgi:hypothetical protein
MANSGKMTPNETNAVLDAGLIVWENVVNHMKLSGLDADLASSVLAVAVAGAMTAEGISPENFLMIVTQTLRLWHMTPSGEGPVLIFSRPLRVGIETPDESVN